MKIIKEVMIKANLADTWISLSDHEELFGLVDSRNDNETKANPRWPSGFKKLYAEPLKRISLSGGIAPSIITTLELFEKGQRTGLKVTIGGWETIDPDRAKNEMPKVSLAWEKKLGILKKEIELAAQMRVEV